MSSQGADVRSIDAIDRFRVSVVEFIDAGRVSITEADSDLDRNIIWLEREQVPYWTRQIRKRQEMVTRAKSDLYRKQMQSGANDGRASVVDEKVALQRAVRRLDEAQSKLQVTRKWTRKLQQQRITFKAAMSGFSVTVDHDLPHAVGLLKKITENLESYLNLSPPDLHRLIAPDQPVDERESMRRTGDESTGETAEEDSPPEDRT
ncbi:MAG: hypothetical protein O3A19_09050 [Planctomycetota bacterium]|jgi:hypothetical protein|nr:hypothetical protein [Planctomycetota bacterium]MDA1026561.1 hypothetical protein [Planctomycetota bacterium]